MLQEFSMMETKVSSSSCMSGDTLDEQVGNNKFNQDIYRKAIGCRLYIATCTRPGIRFAVVLQKSIPRILEKFKESYEVHKLNLTYSGLGSGVEVFCDAVWANDKN
ncbi:hypothetical protein PR048_030657 [Dryococelus australis]|uniref:Uncharacterized protein n=1 Tax=Dryococelus australis TaxID=614101 RepID=A0ABQ9G9J6_9NEOP|nr:hypothetical protein PR048_030657 [Dryococelus australis]